MRLSPKLLLLVGAVTAVGFASLVWLQTVRTSDSLIAAHRGHAEAVAATLAAGIQNIMLTGKGVLAEEFVQDARRLPGVERVHVYDRTGTEVYLPREKRTGGTDALVASVIASGAERRSERLLIRPLRNATPCHRCHEPASTWRGAVALQLGSRRLEARQATSQLVFRFVHTALKNVMLSGEADQVTGFLESVRGVSGVEGVAVLGPDGLAKWSAGLTVPDAAQGDVKRLLAEGGTAQSGELSLVAVDNEPRCHVCHGETPSVRGLVAMRVGAVAPEAELEVAASLFERSLIQLMVSDRGNQLEDYLSELRDEKDLIAQAGLYDGAGTEVYPPTLAQERHVKGAQTQDPLVLGALESGRAAGDEAQDVLRQIIALPNDVRCQACHGSDHPVRGAISVETDLRPSRAAIRASVTRGALVTAGLVLAISVLLFLFLRQVMVRPILEVSQVARRVAEGDLAAEVGHQAKDEIGDLSRRMNEMIVGLRSKLMMERFVGDHTRRMIDESVRGAIAAHEPVRRKITVLFSDVRGFTSYSERHDPERVIRTLNVYLGLQADVIERFGGYVDKFVGDQVMALFEGEGMERRAVDAARAMLAVVNEAPVTDRMDIGIGVNSGEAVFGSTGSEGRQDYTVIGDVVNLGARLCSAAGANTIYVSESVRDAVVDAEDLRFDVREEISVKGKAQVVGVYRVLG